MVNSALDRYYLDCPVTIIKWYYTNIVHLYSSIMETCDSDSLKHKSHTNLRMINYKEGLVDH